MQAGAVWIHVPADDHSIASPVSFADGHAESWKWTQLKAGRPFRYPSFNEADRDDFMQRREGALRQADTSRL